MKYMLIGITLFSLCFGCGKSQREKVNEQRYIEAKTEELHNEKMKNAVNEYVRSLQFIYFTFHKESKGYLCAVNFQDTDEPQVLREEASAEKLLKSMGYPENSKVLPTVIVHFNASYEDQMLMSKYFFGEFHDELKPERRQFISREN
jgi:hypothetical protein